ncbi:MinD/ParA family protein [Tsukamurella sp. 8F]|uniref:MinD/ParA family ATP-binding protein n=1 Tax=unclassified Tsukamurella TaxID=2633480 RepID=UPI0023B932B1|nr:MULTISPECIES: MinD/ParA family protein [unclassified Tsukamurella]MDF0531140.1 MinD/ParA family protein [Tsukamurella sp. 8J]MDF0588386.1 MinD/ParA family protein [Tsukamurella sp. 8F]
MGLRMIGPSAVERLENAQIERIQFPVRNPFVCAVLNHKGASTKTSVTLGIGSAFAKYRRAPRVLAIDADIAFGNLGERVLNPPPQGFRELLAREQKSSVQAATDLGNYVGFTRERLNVLGGENSADESVAGMTPGELHALLEFARRWYDIILIDCTNDLRSPLVEEAVKASDAVVIAAALRADSTLGAGNTLDFLESRGYDKLIRNAIVVLSDIYDARDKTARKKLESKFRGMVHTVRAIGYDKHIATAGALDLDRTSRASQLAFTEIAASLAELFSTSSDQAGHFDAGAAR